MLSVDRRRLPPPQLLLVTAWDAGQRKVEFITRNPQLAGALAAEYGSLDSHQLGPERIFTLHVSILYDVEDVLSFIKALAGLTSPAGVVHDW